MNNCIYAKRFSHALRSYVGSDGFFHDEVLGPLIDVNSIGKLVYFSFNDVCLCVYLRKGDHLEYNIKFNERVGRENVLFKLGSGYIVSHLRKLKVYTKKPFEWKDCITKFGVDPTRVMNSFLFSDNVFRHSVAQQERNIRSFLLDQRIIAGLDSRLTDKILNKNFIDPSKTLAELDEDLFKTLIKNIVSVCNKELNVDIACSDYLERCVYCNKMLSKIVVAGRNCHWCQDCQDG